MFGGFKQITGIPPLSPPPSSFGGFSPILTDRAYFFLVTQKNLCCEVLTPYFDE
jgi:hypothetical protein